jgi:uncharacterized protein (UPF0332 family)
MSVLLEKSKQNKAAFAFLKNKGSNAALVHCGYYSCFQKMKYILKEYYTPEFNNIHLLLDQRRKGSTHNEYIKEFIRQYTKLTDKKQAHDIGNKIKQLKAFRMEADYEDKQLVSDDVIESVEKIIETFHRSVTQNFNI